MGGYVMSDSQSEPVAMTCFLLSTQFPDKLRIWGGLPSDVIHPWTVNGEAEAFTRWGVSMFTFSGYSRTLHQVPVWSV